MTCQSWAVFTWGCVQMKGEPDRLTFILSEGPAPETDEWATLTPRPGPKAT